MPAGWPLIAAFKSETAVALARSRGRPVLLLLAPCTVGAPFFGAQPILAGISRTPRLGPGPGRCRAARVAEPAWRRNGFHRLCDALRRGLGPCRQSQRRRAAGPRKKGGLVVGSHCHGDYRLRHRLHAAPVAAARPNPAGGDGGAEKGDRFVAAETLKTGH